MQTGGRNIMLTQSRISPSTDVEMRRERSCPPGGDMAKLSERIEVLESRLRELKHRQQRVEARKRSLQGQRERREDTRRKILVGALVLTQVERGEYPRDRLHRALDAFLTRPGDRALFNLDTRATRRADGSTVAARQDSPARQPDKPACAGLTQC
jgi:hypothetical protein